MFFSPFSIAITSLGEERANLSAFRTFVRFVLVWICRFPLPLGVWEGLRFVIVTLPGLFSFRFLLSYLVGMKRRTSRRVACKTDNYHFFVMYLSPLMSEVYLLVNFFSKLVKKNPSFKIAMFGRAGGRRLGGRASSELNYLVNLFQS